MKFISLVSFTFYCNVCLQCAKWNREYFVTTRINTAGMGFALADRVLCSSYGEKNIRIDFSISNGSNSSCMCRVVFQSACDLKSSFCKVGGNILLVQLLKGFFWGKGKRQVKKT